MARRKISPVEETKIESTSIESTTQPEGSMEEILTEETKDNAEYPADSESNPESTTQPEGEVNTMLGADVSVANISTNNNEVADTKSSTVTIKITVDDKMIGLRYGELKEVSAETAKILIQKGKAELVK